MYLVLVVEEQVVVNGIRSAICSCRVCPDGKHCSVGKEDKAEVDESDDIEDPSTSMFNPHINTL